MFMISSAKIKKKTICITGMNIQDGMGDIAHILNIGSSIEKQFPSFNIIYHVEWQHLGSTDSLKKLTGLLKNYKIIPKNVDIQAETTWEYIDIFNAINKNKFTVFLAPRFLDDYKKAFHKEKINNIDIDHFVVVSAPFFVKDCDRCTLRPVMYNNKRILFITEHGRSDAERECFLTDFIVRMGFSESTRSAQPPVPDIGILLEDNVKLRSEEQQLEALTQIQNKKFNTLLFGDLVPKPDNAEEYLKALRKTLFIPTYFIHGESVQHMERILLAIKGCLPHDERDVFLQGSFSQELFSDNSIKLQLKDLGFTKIEYTENTSDTINSIDLENEKGEKERILKILSKVYLSDNDYSLLNKELSTILMGCSGDNSFQDAISRGAIPIFFPHGRFKLKLLHDLKNLLQKVMQEQQKDWSSCIAFLESYEKQTHPVFTTALIDQWQEVCVYLIQNHNTHNQLKEVVSNFMRMTALDTKVTAYQSILKEPGYWLEKDGEILTAVREVVTTITTKAEVLELFNIMLSGTNLLHTYLNTTELKPLLPNLFEKFNQHLDLEQRKLLVDQLGGDSQYEALRNIVSTHEKAQEGSKPKKAGPGFGLGW